MDASFYIASRLRFKGKAAIICIAVSFFVMIVAVAVSAGFRHAVRASLSDMSGDILLSAPDLNVMNGTRPVDASDPCLAYVVSSELVSKVVPTVWRAGIVKHGESMHGVVVKGVPTAVSDTVPLGISIPRKLSRISGLNPGDRMLTYFVGDDLKVRQFNVVEVHDAVVETDDRFIVYASLSDMQRLNGWDENQVSAIEVHLTPGHDDEASINAATQEIGSIVSLYQEKDDLVATSSVSRYPQLFAWLSLIDFNVGIILLLMTVVAGFNMISGLLIMLFENISTIGVLKSLGMTDRSISKVFLASSAVLVGKGMAIGNILAIVVCIIQKTTHVLKLDPENYYVSFVPVDIDPGMVLLADGVSFAAIMVLLLIPCLFISKVDPARTVRVR
ncbi:MAG: FtsX-like permease family protein [Bacteroidales bacterium]|nr:FtsX-like permease family protein [Bacteroidales bacterium]